MSEAQALTTAENGWHHANILGVKADLALAQGNVIADALRSGLSIPARL